MFIFKSGQELPHQGIHVLQDFCDLVFYSSGFLLLRGSMAKPLFCYGVVSVLLLCWCDVAVVLLLF